MDFVCVVNPVSGRGRSMKLAHKLEERLKADGHNVKVLETHGDSEEFAKICSVITTDDRVICIGGDGTLLYFLNHCTTFHSVAFYGMGTANVISVEFGIPRRVEKFVDMLETNHVVNLKPGVTDDGTRFLMMCSFGLDGLVLDRVTQLGKNRIGKLAFTWPVLRSLFGYKYPTRQVRVDDGASHEAVFAVISRIKHYGGPFVMAPDADPCGDQLQVVLTNKPGLFATIRLLLYLALGRTTKCPGVTVLSGKEIHISDDGDKIHFQTDGDLHPRDIKQVSVLNETFPLVIPNR